MLSGGKVDGMYCHRQATRVVARIDLDKDGVANDVIEKWLCLDDSLAKTSDPILHVENESRGTFLLHEKGKSGYPVYSRMVGKSIGVSQNGPFFRRFDRVRSAQGEEGQICAFHFKLTDSFQLIRSAVLFCGPNREKINLDQLTNLGPGEDIKAMTEKVERNLRSRPDFANNLNKHDDLLKKTSNFECLTLADKREVLNTEALLDDLIYEELKGLDHDWEVSDEVREELLKVFKFVADPRHRCCSGIFLSVFGVSK